MKNHRHTIHINTYDNFQHDIKIFCTYFYLAESRDTRTSENGMWCIYICNIENSPRIIFGTTL